MSGKRKREREAPEVGAMAGRVVRALVRRAGEGDGEALEQLLALESQIAQAIKDAGAGMHAFGYSFTELGDIAGISRQAARERFGRRQLVDDTPNTPEIPTPSSTAIETAQMGIAR